MPSALSASVQPQVSATNGGSVPSDRGAPAKSNQDPAFKANPPLKDPCFVIIHLIESTHSGLPAGKPPSAFVYKRNILKKTQKR